MKSLSPARQAHLCALMAWNDKYSLEEAEKLASETNYEELDGITFAETSIDASIKGIEDRFDIKLDKEQADFANCQLKADEETYNKIIMIVANIHDKWVREKANKYDRGSEEKSDKILFQHLPTALIGLDEISKDLMFLAPFLKEMGVETGQMQMTAYGAFVPNEQIEEAYQRYVEAYKEHFEISSIQGLEQNILDSLESYEPLTGTSEVERARVKYMKGKIKTLINSVRSKNEQEFGRLKNESQPE